MVPTPPNSPLFMTADRFAVVGRVLNDRSRFDNQVLRWYLDRGLKVTGVRPKSDRFDNSELVEGAKVVDDVTALPDLPNTSISIIIAPPLGLQMMEKLFPAPRDPAKEPRAVWFQPGAESDEIAAFVKERGIGHKVVMGGHACVLVSGDMARHVDPARRGSLM